MAVKVSVGVYIFELFIQIFEFLQSFKHTNATRFSLNAIKFLNSHPDLHSHSRSFNRPTVDRFFLTFLASQVTLHVFRSVCFTNICNVNASSVSQPEMEISTNFAKTTKLLVSNADARRDLG